MLIVIDVMGTGETVDDTTSKKVDPKRVPRPQLHELPQEALQIVEVEQKRVKKSHR